MLNIFIILFIIFGVYQFITGFDLIIQEPINLLSSILAIIFFQLIIFGTKNSIKNIKINKNGLIDKIQNNKYFRYPVAAIMYILAIGNFAYANNYFSSTISKGAVYMEAVIFTLLGFLLIKKSGNVKK
jgi:hypothetical protein